MESVWLDVLGLDSAHDYDPVWQRCLELGVSPSFHANGRGVGFGLRAAPSNFTYNHIGHFAAAGEAVCKALFFGGVTHRFPDLRFAFLEGGVAWACQLLNDIVEHWELRNADALADLDPRRLDHTLLNELGQRYGNPEMQRALAARMDRPPSAKAGAGGRPSRPRRLRRLRHHQRRRHPGPVRGAVLVRLRGRGPAQHVRLQERLSPAARPSSTPPSAPTSATST